MAESHPRVTPPSTRREGARRQGQRSDRMTADRTGTRYGGGWPWSRADTRLRRAGRRRGFMESASRSPIDQLRPLWYECCTVYRWGEWTKRAVVFSKWAPETTSSRLPPRPCADDTRTRNERHGRYSAPRWRRSRRPRAWVSFNSVEGVVTIEGVKTKYNQTCGPDHGNFPGATHLGWMHRTRFMYDLETRNESLLALRAGLVSQGAAQHSMGGSRLAGGTDGNGHNGSRRNPPGSSLPA